MFAVWCPIARSNVLRWSSDLVSIAHPEPGAIDVLIRCECGQLVLLRTGRARGGAEETVHGVASNALGAPRAPDLRIAG